MIGATLLNAEKTGISFRGYMGDRIEAHPLPHLTDRNFLKFF